MQIFRTIVKLIHPSRTLIYLLLLNFGIAKDLVNFVDKVHFQLLIIILILNLSLVIAYIAMAGLNDLFDYSIDCISNPTRPLVCGLITKNGLQKIIWIAIIISLLLSLSVSITSSILMVIVLILGALYSAPPFRLRQYLFIGHGILTIIALLTILIGQSLTHKSILITRINWHEFLAIAIVFFVASQFKDIKDVDGDKANYVTTLATIFGAKKAYWLVGFGLIISIFFLMLANILPYNLFLGLGVLLFTFMWITIQNSEKLFWALIFGLMVILHLFLFH